MRIAGFRRRAEFEVLLTLAPYHYICARGVRRGAAPGRRRHSPSPARAPPSPPSSREHRAPLALRVYSFPLSSQPCRRCKSTLLAWALIDVTARNVLLTITPVSVLYSTLSDCPTRDYVNQKLRWPDASCDCGKNKSW